MSRRNATPALPGGGRGNRRFRALLNVVVPEAAALSEEEWRVAQEIMARALAVRPAAVRRQIGLFMSALDVASFVRYGRTMPALETDAARHLLEALSKAKLLFLRRGVWGVRTLAFMGYYARAEAARAIGYRAAAGGWTARQDASAHD
jgi:hypothetical protein